MIITYHGENAFRLQAGETVILIDPEHQRSFRGARGILSTTRPAHVDPPTPGPEAPFWIDHAGEYDLGPVSIRGITTEWDRDDEHTAYRVTFDDIDVGILGFLAHDPRPEVRELLAGVNILITPAGGTPFLSVSGATKFARQLEPAIVIPSLTDPTAFVKELGGGAVMPEERLTVKASGLTPRAVRVVVLTS